MTFELKKITAKEMSLIVEMWRDSFSRKKGGDPITKNALSIATQMQDSLARSGHGHLWLAKDNTKEQGYALLIADDHKDGLIIRFLLSNIFDAEAKGSGKFLVQEMVNFAEKRGLNIRTTSQNADAFWKKCPGFQLDPSNPPDYVCSSAKPGAAAAGFFKGPAKTMKHGGKSPKPGM